MDTLRQVWIELLQTLLRLLPWPCETGVVALGRPGRSSPVLLTCNFRLTVERVRRALAGIDAYLLVANSRGVNVWCAATGGLLTDHDVVSVLKTSGIEDLVDHRQVILPQLAATGIETKAVQRRAGWRVVWGPVRAADVPAFLERGLESTREMRTVAFPWRQRIEMAIAWAFPISLVALALLLPFWSEAALPVVGLVWALSLLIFASFPLYERALTPSGTSIGFVFFDFGRRGLPLALWLLLMVGPLDRRSAERPADLALARPLGPCASPSTRKPAAAPPSARPSVPRMCSRWTAPATSRPSRVRSNASSAARASCSVRSMRCTSRARAGRW